MALINNPKNQKGEDLATVNQLADVKNLLINEINEKLVEISRDENKIIFEIGHNSDIGCLNNYIIKGAQCSLTKALNEDDSLDINFEVINDGKQLQMDFFKNISFEREIFIEVFVIEEKTETPKKIIGFITL